ncbi:hypothetical protein BC828DRAFT_376945 [Blastocladiella britannica]|nr:hypothetical protein BC828DRAFT_376945 [Blastocladiella britannica]
MLYLPPQVTTALALLATAALAVAALSHARFRAAAHHAAAHPPPGTRIVIVGASSGVGASLAVAYASRGCSLVLSARRTEQLDAVQQQCVDAGAARVLVVAADATDPVALRALHDRAVAFFASAPKSATANEKGNEEEMVDRVVYCAGALTVCPFSATQRMRDEDAADLINRVFAVNATAPILLARVFWPSLRRAAEKRLTANDSEDELVPPQPAFAIVSSAAGILPAPSRALYCGAKAALHGFFDALRIEERREPCPVRVLLMAPGTILGTDLRATALDRGLWEDDMPTGTTRGGVPVDTVVAQMLAQVDDLVTVPAWYGVVRTVRTIAPDLIDWAAMRKYRTAPKSRS